MYYDAPLPPPMHTHTLVHAVADNELSKAIINHEVVSNSLAYREFLATHIEPTTRRSTDGCFESLGAANQSTELCGAGVQMNTITRDRIVRKLRELKYNSLAVALETGTLKKLDLTPVIIELRNLHASLL